MNKPKINVQGIKTKEAAEISSFEDSGFISGYLSVFDVIDSYGDIVRKGAFTESLKAIAESGRKVPLLWQHNTDEPIGYYTELKEDDHGLYFEAQLLINDIPRAKHAFVLLKSKSISGKSIGYKIKRYEVLANDNMWDSLELIEVELKEGSVVTFGANPDTHVESVKSEQDEPSSQDVNLEKACAIIDRLNHKAALDKLALVVSKLNTKES